MYKQFDDWFWELENYGMRGERFYEEFSNGITPERALEWLRACWQCARNEHERDTTTS